MENVKGKLRYCSIKDGVMSEWAIGDGLDRQLESGYYLVEIHHTGENDGLPVSFCGNEHYLLAHLLVTESGTGDRLQRDRVIGQTLVFTDRQSAATGVFSRSGEFVADGVVWGEWTQASAGKDSGKEVLWDANSNIDAYTGQGTYAITGERLNSGDGLPIANSNPGHTISARLVVLDSSITGAGESDDKCITQVLTMSNRTGGDGDIYVRTGRAASKNQLMSGSGWEPWGRLQQNVQVGQVASLDSFIGNGIYSGVYTYGSSVETFVMVVINNYAVSAANGEVRSISQFKYALGLDGTFSYKTRVGQGSSGVSWGNWVDMGATRTADIQDNSITAQKLSADVREKVENPFRALYIAAGAKYNNITGLYSLNGVDDLTEEQMQICYDNKELCTNLNWGNIARYMTQLRTIYPFPQRTTNLNVSQTTNGWSWNSSYTFMDCVDLEVFRICQNAPLDTTSTSDMLSATRLHWTFYDCVDLHTVYPINVENVTSFPNTFYKCRSLVNLRLYGVKCNLSLAQSPLISKESLLYIVNNSLASDTITITLHADAYATLAEDTDIISALEAKPLVTLVSA